MNLRQLWIVVLVGTGLVSCGAASAKSTKLNRILTKQGASLVIGGHFKTESALAKNCIFLNNSMPDEPSYFKTIGDIEGDLTWGKETYEHNAIHAHLGVRTKWFWGNASASVTSASQSFQIGHALRVGDHSHDVDRPALWCKNAWVSVSLDALANLENQGTHIIKMGSFPMSFGRGIALGDGYGTKKRFLGVYQRSTDYDAPGLALTGRVYEGQVGYDIYFARFEDRGSDPRFSLEQSRPHRLDVSPDKTWRGTDNNDDLFGIQLMFAPSSQVLGKATAKPYCFLNAARDKQIEMPSDASSNLFTFGCAFEYENGPFEFGGEVAMNRGEEKLYPIDRMKIDIQKATTAHGQSALCEYLTHLQTRSKKDETKWVDDPIEYTDAMRTEIRKDSHRDGAPFTVIEKYKEFEGTVYNSESFTYRSSQNTIANPNAQNRLRSGFTNRYRGWMVIGDAAYTVVSPQVKMAVMGGVFSGDSYPNSPEVDKDYVGFVGLNEKYTGKRVKSAILLDARSIKRPLVVDDDWLDLDFSGDDNTLTDMRFFGYSMAVSPKRLKNMNLMTNVILAWKDFEMGKPEYVDGAWLKSTTETANSFLGTEWNVMMSTALFETLNLTLVGAFFFPGGFYRDIKGIKLAAKEVKKTFASDLNNAGANVLGMGNDTAFLVKATVDYKF